MRATSRYLLLTGETRDRQRVVDAFEAGRADVFLISLKAGGTGLNLTSADTVVHYDPWWNPAAQAQATDRAYRIGQTRPVFVHNLYVAGSVEERVLALQQRKSGSRRPSWETAPARRPSPRQTSTRSSRPSRARKKDPFSSSPYDGRARAEIQRLVGNLARRVPHDESVISLGDQNRRRSEADGGAIDLHPAVDLRYPGFRRPSLAIPPRAASRPRSSRSSVRRARPFRPIPQVDGVRGGDAGGRDGRWTAASRLPSRTRRVACGEPALLESGRGRGDAQRAVGSTMRRTSRDRFDRRGPVR